MTVTASEKINF
jgi:phytoene dehydrogenase-like protein